MIADELHELWDARPFVPFEVALSNGETFTVTNPKPVLMSPCRVNLVTPGGRMHTMFHEPGESGDGAG